MRNWASFLLWIALIAAFDRGDGPGFGSAQKIAGKPETQRLSLGLFRGGEKPAGIGGLSATKMLSQKAVLGQFDQQWAKGT